MRVRANAVRRRLAPLLLACAFAALPVEQAFAQEGIDTYPAAYFAGNQPATAYDMVALLPGFHLQIGDSTVRGFSGTVGNVLIDGQLPTSKDESVVLLLQRIAPSSVEPIELIRGAADMHGYAVLANVVRNKGAVLRARAELEGGITHYGTTEDKVAMHVTRQGESSTIELSGNWGRDIGAQNQNGFGTRVRVLPNGAPMQLSNYSYPLLTNNSAASASYRQPLWIGDLSLGAAFKQSRAYSNVSESIYFPAVSLVTGYESKLARNGELQLDYQLPLGDFGQVQLFGVHRVTAQDEISRTANATSASASRGLFNQREDVTRLAWHFSPGSLKLEAGAEGSINVLSSRSTLTQSGVLVILPAANIRLEEKRLELFSTATWRINPALMSELGAHYETSTLTQSGDSTLTKDLGYFKPHWLTTWDFAPGQELRLLMERQVGQLNFRDFAASTSLNGNTINGGNKNLEPTRSWIVSLDWEQHFWKRGSLVVEARREMISDVYDHVPVFAGTQVFNAAGNIGYGTRDGVQANLILPLDEVGLEGVTMTATVDGHHSRVRDPATGLYRQIGGGQTYSGAQFVFDTTDQITYDMPSRNLRLGLDMHSHGGSLESDSRIDEIDHNTHGVKVGVFAEYKPTRDWTIRVFDRDMLQTAGYRDRYVFSGLRGVAPLSYIEYRNLSNGAVIGLDLQHDF